jgi:hypothetical protein
MEGSPVRVLSKNLLPIEFNMPKVEYNTIRKNELLDNPETRPVGVVGYGAVMQIREIVGIRMTVLRSEAEPDQYPLCTGINEGHQANLGIALLHVVLINANCIDPDCTWGRREAKIVEGIV